jgi:hypothetical protein
MLELRFKNNLFNSENEGLGCMRMIGWRDGVLYDWENKDYESLMQSNFYLQENLIVKI